MAQFNFVGGSYQSLSPNADCQRTLNLYPETIESGDGAAKIVLYDTPGITLAWALPKSPIRCVFAGENRLFVVAGDHLYELFASAGPTYTYNDRGIVGNDGLPAQIFANGNQLFIVSAGMGYCDNGPGPALIFIPNGSGTVNITPLGAGSRIDLVSGDPFDVSQVGQNLVLPGGTYLITGFVTSTQITIAVILVAATNVAYSCVIPFGSQCGAFLDGYFVSSTPNSKQLQTSALSDGTTWSPLDYGTKEAYPDNIVQLLADHEQLWVCGYQTTEVWQDIGNAQGIPFSRFSGGFINQGTIAPFTWVSINNSVAWLGADARGGVIAWLASGFIPQRISNHAVEQIWRTYSKVSDAVAFAYVEDGHQFWCISFPTGNATWVYDFNEQMWHQRGWFNGTFTNGYPNIDRQRQAFHAYADIGLGLQHYVGDWQNGNIYIQSRTTYLDNGAARFRIRAAPHINEERKWIFYSRFWLDMETGDGSSPIVTLDWSDDGGHTWGVQYTTTAGAIGAFIWRVIFRRLGRSRDRVYRIMFTGNSPCSLINAYLEFKQGTS